MHADPHLATGGAAGRPGERRVQADEKGSGLKNCGAWLWRRRVGGALPFGCRRRGPERDGNLAAARTLTPKTIDYTSHRPAHRRASQWSERAVVCRACYTPPSLDRPDRRRRSWASDPGTGRQGRSGVDARRGEHRVLGGRLGREFLAYLDGWGSGWAAWSS